MVFGGCVRVNLTDKDIRLLSALGRRPLESASVLCKEVGVTSATFSKRLKKLYDNKILLSISAEVNYPSLGLEPVFYFLESPFRFVKSVERALDLHPYTRYRVRSLGALNGLYTLFAVPAGTLNLLNEFVERLVGLGYVKDYYFDLSMGPWAYSETDFQYFNLDDGSWSFDWNQWESSVLIDSPPHSCAEGRPTSVLHELDGRDMRILRQLSMNAARRKKVIASEAKVPDYHLSRRWKKLEKHVIDSYRVVVNREASKLFATLMFECDCTDPVRWKFTNALPTLPFQSTLMPSGRGFLLQTAIHSLDLPQLGRILQKYCRDVRVLWSDYSSSMRYWFWDEPFQGGEWISSRDYMVDSVVEALAEKQSPQKPRSIG